LESESREDLDLQTEDNRIGEKRLARGLEDVSYLFLSQAGGEEGKGTSLNAVSGQARPQPAPAAAPMVLRASSSAIDRELLISLLAKNAAVLEDGLRSIDVNVPCDPFGSIDVLLLDGLDQLVLVDIDSALNDSLLLRGIGHFDWLIRNTPVLRRMYQGRAINFSAQPRVFLIAPVFSQLLKCAVQRTISPKVSCFGIHTVTLPGGIGIFFEGV
jgi:hypothetical protein